MKLIRFGALGQEKPGLLINGQRKDLSSVFNDWDKDFFNNEGLKKLDECLKNISIYPNVDESERWGACVARPGKVICIGLNYSDHAEESGMATPKEPIIFQKGSNTVVGPYDDVLIPRNSEKTDWEVELGVIIGKDTRYLNSIKDAEDCIAGYCISHDVSERAFQLERGGQWTKGKSCDNFNPLGPYLLNKNSVENVQNLKMRLLVNGVQKQFGNTSFMIFDVFHVIHHLSQFMTLEAGDLINTGTPPGVGLGFNPPEYLKEGDIIELEIDCLGSQKQVCVKA